MAGVPFFFLTGWVSSLRVLVLALGLSMLVGTRNTQVKASSAFHSYCLYKTTAQISPGLRYLELMPRGRPKARQNADATHLPQLTMRERSYLHIQSQISTGQLQAGSPISELVLAKELGSSRTPIREAIGQLVAEGLLEQTPTGTTLVVCLQRQDIEELYELREALETYVIEKVAGSAIHEHDRDRLQRLVDDILVLQKELQESGARALDTSQMNRFLASDFAFHSMLMSMAHNSRIQKVLNEMRLLIRIFSIERRGHEMALLETIHRHHQQILDSVFHQDSARARQLLGEHIRTSLKERLDEFDHWRRERSFRESMPSFLETIDSPATAPSLYEPASTIKKQKASGS